MKAEAKRQRREERKQSASDDTLEYASGEEVDENDTTDLVSDEDSPDTDLD